eukprot:SM000075S21966  [mRNA]  locus=s75:335751:343270:+ [translate_table: standard]
MAPAAALASAAGLRAPVSLPTAAAHDPGSVRETTARCASSSIKPGRASVQGARRLSVAGGPSARLLLAQVQLKHTQRRQAAASIRCEATATAAAPPAQQEEKYEYQAEVSRLLDLIVHSLYSHKEVFLRELVSNASDALDKLRFLSVTDGSLLADGSDLVIRIKADKAAGTITISDTGIGMTRQELQESLGTIAQSGTAKFVQALKDNKDNEASAKDNNLIGQFGVGFYSAFLVANKVTVSTKSAKDDKQWVWEAEAEQSSYVIREETDPDRKLPRGTSITLHIKADDVSEYTDPNRIEGLVKNYSQFISFPIYSWKELSRDKEVEEDEEVKEGEEPKKKTKTIQEKYYDWALVNDTKPIWMRSPKDVAAEDYNSFFKNTFQEFLDPMAYTHFTTEGEIEFRSLLFIPGMAPFNQDELMNPKSKNIRLYVKRVFISDEFDGELFPRYLSFIKGVVDSNDLPLNVSREILQESRVVRIMKKRLIRKTFDMIEEIASREKSEDYKTFWSSFGKNIKLGCIEDSANHNKLAPLLRFSSSKTDGDDLISLKDYIGRMKEEQKSIYYLAADTLKSAKSAPFLEALSSKDYEVLFLVEPIDEVAVTSLASFENKKFVDISKEDLDLGEHKQSALDSITRLGVACPIPHVAYWRRLMKAQAMGDASQVEFMRGRRVLEVNPNHPILQDLNVTCKQSPNDAQAKQLVELLYETAHLASGFTPENPADFGGRIYELMGLAMLGGKRPAAQDASPVADATPASSGESGEGESTVVEASEVRTEGDPWK